jgi:carbon storage regulator
MLVLKRNIGQQITIGPDITVTVVRLTCNSVSIGIDAPPEYAILRDDAANREARIDRLTQTGDDPK